MQFRLLLLTFALFISLIVLIPSPVRADSVIDQYLSGGHLNFEFSDDTITDTIKFETELELRFRGEGFDAFVRGTNDRPYSYQTEDYAVTKRGFNFDLNDDWTVTGGDYSLIFGRGTALDATESRAVDRDAQLDGFMVDGDLGFGNMTAFWGTHKSDGPEYHVSGVNTNEGGPADELWGGRMAFDWKNFDLGVGYIDAETTRYSVQESVAITEIDASVKIDNTTLYYESVWFNRNQPEIMEESNDGRAQLAQFIYAERGISLSGEWVRYDNAKFDYATAPSLRRPEIDNSAAHPDDETGYRVDCRFSPDSWDGNSLRVLYADLNGIENKNQSFNNIFVEWSSPSSGEWSGSLSYDRIEGFLLLYGALNGKDENYRATLDGPFFAGGSFHLTARVRSLSNDFNSDDELELGFDWRVSPELTIGGFHETSTRDIEPPPPGLYDIPVESPGHWNSVYVRWTPDPWSQVELMYGSQRGGFQCAGGVCAQLPPFKGLRLTFYRTL